MLKRIVAVGWICNSLLAVFCECGYSQNKFDSALRELVKNEIAPNGVTNQHVLDAILATKRHEFVPIAQRKLAYFDMALPIGSGQTISSPFIVAYMTQSLDPQPTDKVLEIGTGSGYQAAVLSPLVQSVYSIEIVEPLGRRAKRVLQRLKYTNVHTKIGDGFVGWPEYAPFDKIIVTCSPEDVPQPLIDQLREDGRMVIPVGERYQQTLCLMKKVDGELVREELRPTLFVPMTGTAESNREVQPDPAHPQIVNGSFEIAEQQFEADGENNLGSSENNLGSSENNLGSPGRSPENFPIPGWYYQRLAKVIEDPLEAPHGDRFVHFSNATTGRSSHILQGFAIDGRHVRQLMVSSMIRLEDVVQGFDKQMRPSIAVTFYDERRRQLGHHFCGPWQGTRDWEQSSKRFRVPPLTREAILRVGLFGATGDFFVDNLRLESRAAE